MPGEKLPQLGQGDVRLGVHSPQDHWREPLDPRRALVAPDPQRPISPVARTRDVQRIALEMLTPNRAAAWRRESPASTAATARLRRSTDSGFMPTGLLTSSHLESDSRPRVNPHRDFAG